MRKTIKESDRIKDLAAKHWHHKRANKSALCDVFSGANYELNFKLHQLAFMAGWDAKTRDAKARKR